MLFLQAVVRALSLKSALHEPLQVLFLQAVDERDIHAAYRALVSDLEGRSASDLCSINALVTRLGEALEACTARREQGLSALCEATALVQSVQRVQPLVEECRLGLAAGVRSGVLAAPGASPSARGAGGGRGNHRAGGSGGAVGGAARAGAGAGAHFRSPASTVASSNARLSKGGGGSAREHSSATGRALLKVNRLKHGQQRRSAASSSSKVPR